METPEDQKNPEYHYRRALRASLHARLVPNVSTDDLVGDAPDVRGWLQMRGADYKQHGLHWLLAHADDGIIWGRLDDGTLVTSRDAAEAFPDEGDGKPETLREIALTAFPALDGRTLQQARLFGQGGELLLWRNDGGFRARVIHDVEEDEDHDWREGFDEPQMLWGTYSNALPRNFRLYRQGAEGLRHAVPFVPEALLQEDIAPRLMVRHYLSKNGFARVVASRLVGFELWI